MVAFCQTKANHFLKRIPILKFHNQVNNASMQQYSQFKLVTRWLRCFPESYQILLKWYIPWRRSSLILKFLIVLKLLIFKKYTPVSWIPQLVEGSIQYELYYTTKCKNCVIQCATGKVATNTLLLINTVDSLLFFRHQCSWIS